MALKEIGEEMNRQDNRATQFPLYVIQVDKKRWVDFGDDYDGKVRVEETDTDKLCEQCASVYAEGKTLDDECEDCEEEAFDYFEIEQQFDLNAGVFFTAKACEEHIQQNAYHYDNPKSFAVSAWRNYEMQEVMQFLSGLGGAVVNFYR